MSLTRKMLKAMGIEEEKIDQIIEAHSETVDAIKTERDSYKEKADEADSLRTELDKAKKLAEKSGADNDSYKVKYEAIKEELDTLKSNIEAEKTSSAKKSAYEKLLKDAGVSEKRIDAIMRVSSVDEIELDDDGKVKDADIISAKIKEEWADFITTAHNVGSKTATPPTNSNGSTMSKAEIFAKDDAGRYKLSASERQKAITENADAFNSNE